ncbi:MAG: hypothetical protein MJ189_01595 [Coriobacteriales bacterium]|nr:hypothetical protein [Coriobacteriales bacterium]
MQLVNKNPYIFVDYAHTPDALEKSLKLLANLLKDNKVSDNSFLSSDVSNIDNDLEQANKQNSSNIPAKIICVFGCGGDRDASKRPIMGQVAEHYSDIVIVTSDNPRSEDPNAIIEQILQGMAKYKDTVFRVLDRKSAIEFAISKAQSSDCILVAGKGHENYQIIGNRKLHFSDFEAINEALNDKGEKKLNND